MTIRTAGPGRVASQADVGALTRYRRACDYLAAAMIYLRDNVLLTEPLRPEHLKPRLVGHWGTCPGITFVYAGVNCLIRATGQRTLLVTGPGHGAPAIHANLWTEGTHGEYDPALSRDRAGLTELVRRFSWPGGFPSHLSPQVPGVIQSAIHELLHGRRDPNRFHVRGYLEEGTTTTPYDLLARNLMSRHDLAADAVSWVAGWSSRAGRIVDRLAQERAAILAEAYWEGRDPEAISGWTWS